MANTSSAYDYSAFGAQPQVQERHKKPQLRVVRSVPRAFASAFRPDVLCAFVIVVAMASLILYNQVCLNEVNGEINRLNTQLVILESESVRFASLLESAISLRAVADQAENELGMRKLDKYQTVYMYLYEQDQIILTRNPVEENPENGVLSVLGHAIETVKEYIGAK